jgi:hypothetical protein
MILRMSPTERMSESDSTSVGVDFFVRDLKMFDSHNSLTVHHSHNIVNMAWQEKRDERENERCESFVNFEKIDFIE